MKKFIAPLAMGLLFTISQLIAVSIAQPFKKAGFEAFENPENPMNIVQIFVIIMVFTLFILIIAKYKEEMVKYIILFSFFLASLSIFQAFFYFISSSLSFLFSLIVSITMFVLLIKHPEWYVIDFFGVFLTGGISAIFAISLSIEMIIIFLIILAIYDAIAVYKTRHMVKLAETIADSNLPLLMIVPKKASYSYIKSKIGKDKDAIYVGLGDLIIPGILITASYLQEGIAGFIFTLTGALAGYFLLMKLISKGPQPGLPYLNGGAIISYAILHFL
ncbi:MAG TPA: hypothetical protein ENI53_00720 [Thermoplasmatales archaeon]|nr:hypothetical protein [Thermoplasmatales archaeon]